MYLYLVSLCLENFFFLLIPGQFYAPEQPGERVLSLSSDQPKNTILVSGDTTGWLQIWDICHFALDVQQEVRICLCACELVWIGHLPEVLSLCTDSLWAASSAAALEGSWGGVSECGSPRGGWQIVRPHSLGWRLCRTVVKGWRSRGLFRAGSDVEYHWPSFLPEVGFMSISVTLVYLRSMCQIISNMKNNHKGSVETAVNLWLNYI